MTYVREDIRKVWGTRDPLTEAFALDGEVYRDVPGRRTLKVEIGGKAYFVKLHYGVGWGEVLKNWLQLKRPVVGAANEYLACVGLHDAGIVAPVPAAFGESRHNMATRRSFVLCDELAGYTSLEDITDTWDDSPPDGLTKLRMLYAVARFARDFHAAGFIHRDFYICHILAEDATFGAREMRLGVLDLHRARRFVGIPRRWRKRDLAALLFSSLDLELSKLDWLRFVRIYTGRPLKEGFAKDQAFWGKILRRAERLYAQGRRKGIVKGRYGS
jgi:heptose I phosphotransferase